MVISKFPWESAGIEELDEKVKFHSKIGFTALEPPNQEQSLG